MTELFADVAPDGRGGTIGIAARRVLMASFALISLAALIGFFGQRSTTSAAVTPSVRMTLDAPETVRGGIFFQALVNIRALTPVEHPRLVLDEGWVEGMQVNSIEPAPVSEASRDGRVVLSYDRVDAGDRLVVWMQFEVDPTNVGHRSYGLELDDAETRVAAVHRWMTVFP